MSAHLIHMEVKKLKEYYQSLSWFGRLFFPKQLKMDMDNNASPQALIQSATLHTWFFQRWLLAGLRAFLQSPIMQSAQQSSAYLTIPQPQVQQKTPKIASIPTPTNTAKSEPIEIPEPLSTPEPEPVNTPEPVSAPEPESPVNTPEPEPVNTPEPVSTPESNSPVNIPEPEPVNTPEPLGRLEPELMNTPEPIRVISPESVNMRESGYPHEDIYQDESYKQAEADANALLQRLDDRFRSINALLSLSVFTPDTPTRKPAPTKYEPYLP